MLRLRCPHISSWQGLLRLWLRRSTIYVSVYLTALSISVLGPLVCIIHCHILLGFFAAPNTANTSSVYFCHFVTTFDQEVVSPSSPLLPSSVYPLAVIGVGSLALLLLLSTRYSYLLGCRNSQTTYLPPTPPPRWVLLCSF